MLAFVKGWLYLQEHNLGHNEVSLLEGVTSGVAFMRGSTVNSACNKAKELALTQRHLKLDLYCCCYVSIKLCTH